MKNVRKERKEYTYCIEWNSIDGIEMMKDLPMCVHSYENITGTSIMDALKKRFDVPLHRARRDDRHPDVAVRKGVYNEETHRLQYWGNAGLYWYSIR